MEHQATSKTNHESSNGTSNGTQEHNTEVPEQPAVDETASLLWRLCHGTEKATLTFAGQGVIDLDAFVDDFVDNEIIRETFLSGSACLEALALDPEARWSGYVSQGMNIAQWLSVPETRPEQTYLSSCVVSQPLILLCQIALYRDLYARGLKKAWNEGAIDSAVGHSQGILPALLIAESPNGDICLERLNDYLRYAFWQGIAMATSYEESGHALRDGDATPMAAVSGMDIRTLSAFVDGVNKQLPPTSAMVISLHNTRTRFVLSGPIPSLRILHSVLEARAKKEAEKKKEGQFGGKPLSFTWEYLDVGGAYHSPYMETGRKLMQERVKALGFSVDASALQIDVYSPDNLKRYNDSPDLTQQMITEQFVRSVQWSAAIRLAVEGTDASFVLDFGPGDGVARLTRSALKGLGARIVPLVLQSGQQQLFEVFEEQRAPVRYTDFLPQRKTLADGSLGIENLYTRATGQRPVILPGMTPTTVEVPIVAAAANAGFTSELAGGGQVSERIFWLRMEELAEQLEPGREIVFNALYLDPYLWDLHVRKTGLVQKARKAGYPICGITISAGLPETSEAVKILDEFASLGMWLNAFKPGTVAQVKRVVEIAKAAPQHTIFVHLEGGKAGGHHSWEDLDQLLLESYHMIREQSNLVLCVGGGIADEDRGVELLNGSWSDKYGVPAMPVDAVFLGTLTMACLEAATSPQVKEALAKVAGGDKWVFAGKFDGGMTSGKSGLNADIHYIDNPASRCGRLLDSVAGDEEAVQARRDEIIETLNATAKPYFGDVEKMTYFEVAERLVSFLAIGRNGRYEDGCWLDVTYRARVFDFLRRAEGRLCEQEAGVVESFLKDPKALDTPQAVLKEFVEVYPQAQTQLLHPLDVRFFVQRICGRPGKPVNFIPVIDANVRRWYKSDSLWQAHDDRYEAEKVLIIPGPEAVKGLKQADEPVASLLGRFEQALVQDVAERGVVEPSLEREDSGWMPSWGVGDVDHDGIINVVASQPPHEHAWEDYFAERFSGPIASLFASHRIIDGKLSRPNPVRQLCRAIPGAKMRIQIEPSNKQVSAIRYQPSEDSTESVVLRVLDNGQKVSFTLTIQQETEDKLPSFAFDLSVSQRAEITNFALEEGAWSRAMRHFYHETMFGQIFDATEPFMSLKTKDALSRLRARGYASVTGGRAARDKSIPLNAAISLTWQPLFRLLSCDEVVDGLFHLVHLDNDFTLCEGWPILSDEEIEVDATITKLQDGDSGRTVQTRCVLTRGDVVCAQIDSTFFIRGFFGHTPFVAREKVELREEVIIADEPALSFLRQHEWLSLQEGVSLKVGDVLEVSAALEEQRPRYETPTFKANGQLTRDGHVVGDISIDVSKDLKLHPLRAWLNILTPATNEPKVARKLLAFETSTTPRELDAFAEISGDLNPIHRSDLVAWLGQLDGIIVHGM